MKDEEIQLLILKWFYENRDLSLSEPPKSNEINENINEKIYYRNLKNIFDFGLINAVFNELENGEFKFFNPQITSKGINAIENSSSNLSENELQKIVLKKYYDERKENRKVQLRPEHFEMFILQSDIERTSLHLKSEGLIETREFKNSTGIISPIIGKITSKGISVIEGTSLNQDYIGINNKNNSKGNEMEIVKIFISHSSEDLESARNFVRLIQNSFDGLLQKHIRCTSIEHYQYPDGVDFIDRIREEMKLTEIVIILGSENYMESTMSIIEAGIAWLFNKAIPVIIDENFTFEDFERPIKDLKGAKAYNKSDLLNFLSRLSQIIQIDLKTSSYVNDEIDNYLENTPF